MIRESMKRILLAGKHAIALSQKNLPQSNNTCLNRVVSLGFLILTSKQVFLFLFFELGRTASSQVLHRGSPSGRVRQLSIGIPSEVPVPTNRSSSTTECA